jgi:hypothetical protein
MKTRSVPAVHYENDCGVSKIILWNSSDYLHAVSILVSPQHMMCAEVWVSLMLCIL